MTYPDAASRADAVIDGQVAAETADIRFEIGEQLDLLAELQAMQDAIRLEKQGLIDQILTPEIRQQIAEIEAEYAVREETVTERLDELTKGVKAAVITFGESVKGQRLHAVYSRGRDSWDSKTLMRLAKSIPEIWGAHSQGKPSVSIRRVA